MFVKIRPDAPTRDPLIIRAWLSIRNIINGYNVTNRNALANPDCLKEYENIYQELKKN